MEERLQAEAVVVEAIAHHKFVGDGKAAIIDTGTSKKTLASYLCSNTATFREAGCWLINCGIK